MKVYFIKQTSIVHSVYHSYTGDSHWFPKIHQPPPMVLKKRVRTPSEFTDVIIRKKCNMLNCNLQSIPSIPTSVYLVQEIENMTYYSDLRSMKPVMGTIISVICFPRPSIPSGGFHIRRSQGSKVPCRFTRTSYWITIITIITTNELIMHSKILNMFLLTSKGDSCFDDDRVHVVILSHINLPPGGVLQLGGGAWLVISVYGYFR